MTAIALTIAGSDSGGGAGIQADLKAFSALGVFGASVLTAITAQNTRAVTAVHEVPADIISAQIEAVVEDLDVGAIKIGMLSSPAIIETVADALSDCDVPIVLDPVMVAKSGDRLLREEAVAALIERLLPMATLLTPNLPEAAILTGRREATSAHEMMCQGKHLLVAGPRAVLMKGGHLVGNSSVVDLLLNTARVREEDVEGQQFSAARVDTQNTHGTGCTLSASIAAGLAKNMPLVDAVEAAHAYLQGAIRAADKLAVGSGHGPVHHFHNTPAWTL